MLDEISWVAVSTETQNNFEFQVNLPRFGGQLMVFVHIALTGENRRSGSRECPPRMVRNGPRPA